jgi:phospholipase/lecithinase/hemolysin
MSQSSALPTYSVIYAFGDSLSDAGNLSIATTLTGTEPVSPPYYQQQYGSLSGNVFSNGPTWVQDLTFALGLGTLKPSLLGGTDFAYGGAETGMTPQNANNPKIQAISLPSQFVQFHAAVPNPAANALYTLSIGSNDLLGILASSGLTAQQQTTDVNDAVANAIAFVKQLVGDGAKNLLVLDVPDLGKVPDVTQGLVNGSNTPSAALDAEASQLSAEYDTALTSQLASLASADALSVNVVDAYYLIDNAVAVPAAYGLTNVTSPVWSGNYTSSSSGTLAATGAAQNQYLFWDHLHPTEAGHQAIAAATAQQLAGVGAGSLLVEDTTTGQSTAVSGQPYSGPVGDLQNQYVNLTTDNLAIVATTPNWFISGGSGSDAITVSSGTNVLDTGSASGFLIGGSGADTFFLDDRAPAADFWSTVVNFHAGDVVTIWGVTAGAFSASWADGQGAQGYTGLTLHVTGAGQPTASLTLAGLTSASLANGKISVSYGSDSSSAIPYMFIHATG